MHRWRSALSASFALVALTAGTAAVVVARSTPPLETVPHDRLAEIRGADSVKNYNTTATCDSNYAANNSMAAGCGSCTATQGNQGKQCSCCDNGGLIDMTEAMNPGSGTVSGINSNTGTSWDCGKVTYSLCVVMGNNASCGTTTRPTQNSCGSVTEYNNQFNPPPIGN